MKKTAIAFGILSGVIIILYSLGVFLIFGDFSKMTTADLAKVEMLGYLRYLILLLTIIFAIRYFKKQNGGLGTFKQLFLAGFYTSLVIALIVGLMELVYIALNPDFFEQYGALTSKSLQEKGASAAEIARKQKEMETMKWMLNPAAMGAFYFFETAILGSIMSAITALVARSRGGKPQVAF